MEQINGQSDKSSKDKRMEDDGDEENEVEQMNVVQQGSQKWNILSIDIKQ